MLAWEPQSKLGVTVIRRSLPNTAMEYLDRVAQAGDLESVKYIVNNNKCDFVASTSSKVIVSYLICNLN